MQRIWKNKPNKDHIKLMEESVDITLYLVQEKGPLSFTFQNEHKKKFHVNVGESISCSCSGGRPQHCVHSLYVLNRMFKIQLDNPLIFQTGYTDAELGKMINWREDRISKKEKKKKKENATHETNGVRMSLFDDISCSICQEDMYSAENLFYCSNSCGHNYHMHCIKVWAEHKKASSDIVSCPMCRSVWEEEEIKKATVKAMTDKTSLKRHKGIECKICNRANIKAERFHCLLCENFDMCVECLILQKHDIDHPLLIKKNPEEKWIGVEYEKGSSSDCKFSILNIKLAQFLVSLLKDFNKSETEEPSKQISKQCVVCKSERASSLQLLRFKKLTNCSHLVHFKCAENIFKVQYNAKINNYYFINKHFNTCRLDSILIFPGLNSLNFKLKVEDEKKPLNPSEKKMADNFVPQMSLDIKSFSVSNKKTSKIFARPKTIMPSISSIKDQHIKPDNHLGLRLDIQKLDCHSNFEEKNPLKSKANKIRNAKHFRSTNVKVNKLKRPQSKIKEQPVKNTDITTLVPNQSIGVKVVNFNPIGFKVKT